jgi:hypothetical protein
LGPTRHGVENYRAALLPSPVTSKETEGEKNGIVLFRVRLLLSNLDDQINYEREPTLVPTHTNNAADDDTLLIPTTTSSRFPGERREEGGNSRDTPTQPARAARASTTSHHIGISPGSSGLPQSSRGGRSSLGRLDRRRDRPSGGDVGAVAARGADGAGQAPRGSGADQAPYPTREALGFAYSMLQKVSRSFALVIQQLGPDLRNAVSNPLPSPAFLPSSPIPRTAY